MPLFLDPAAPLLRMFPVACIIFGMFKKKKNVHGYSHAALYLMAEFWKQAMYPPGGADLIKSGPPHKKQFS